MSAEAQGASVAYLDSSALVKLVVAEPESAALRRHLRARPVRASCGLARVEVIRAVRQHGREAIERARRVLSRTRLLRIDDSLLYAAADLAPDVPRSLDAIHLAAALAFGDELRELVTYDARMTLAAATLGVKTAAPS
jgi:predicted nucleic acid-binding protein